MVPESFESRVVKIIKEIPRGKIATYGQIAALALSPRSALMVGRILRNKSEIFELPWHRVTGKNGRITIVNINFPAEIQAELLKSEGVEVEKSGNNYTANYAKYMWVR
ncbi:MGMT family protein [Candidatus Berkelbacteria bacterium]|nr:MGMT family protein [Candidatus Berkelbacteria bacterium]